MEIEQQKQIYQIGQCIQFQDGEETKIGRIEDQNLEDGWFDCFIYLTPEQTTQGRQYYHGCREIFKTKTWQRYDDSKIIRKIQIVKLPQFLQIKDAIQQEQVFIQRQDYDQISQQYTPSLQKCICGKYVNPDDVLVVCDQCQKAFCAKCLKINLNGSKHINCDFCRNPIQEQTIMQKYEQLLLNKPELKKTNSTKTAHQILNDTGNNQNNNSSIQNQILLYEEDEDIDEMNLSKKGPKIDLDKLAKKIKQNDQTPIEILQKNSSNGAANNTNKIFQSKNSQSQQQQQQSNFIDLTVQLDKQHSNSTKQIVRQMKNISEEQVEKINNFVRGYKLSETAIPNISKKRIEVRERLLQILFYGVEELRDLLQKDPSQIKKLELNLIQLDDQSMFVQLKKLVLEIEIALHLKFNTNHQRNERLDPGYIDRCKLVYCHLKDDKNLDLRRKVLIKEFTAQDLCHKEERELYNPDKKRETLEMSKLNFELNQKINVQQGLIQPDEEPEILLSNKTKQSTLSENQGNALIQTDIYKSLQEYLPKQQYQRILNRFKSELKQDTSIDLIKELQKIYKIQ